MGRLSHVAIAFGIALALNTTFANDPVMDAPPPRPAQAGGAWGYIDKDREFVIPPKFNRAGPFSEGLAPVRVDERYGYIDSLGRTRIEPRFELADSFSEGLAAIKVAGRYGYIDGQGATAIDGAFEWAGPFRQGLAAVKVDGKYGYVNKQGMTVIAPIYRFAAAFSEGLAAVETDRGSGFIDQSGKLVIDPSFRNVGPFREGVAWAQMDDKFGYLRPDGKFAIDPKFSYARSFRQGGAVVCSGGNSGVVDSQGQLLVPFEYDFIEMRGPRDLRVARGLEIMKVTISANGQLNSQPENNPDFVPADLRSNPEGAIVYRPSLWDYEHAPSVDRLLTPENRVPNRGTNVIVYLDRFQVYRLIFVRQDKREERHCIPGIDTRNPITVEFP